MGPLIRRRGRCASEQQQQAEPVPAASETPVMATPAGLPPPARRSAQRPAAGSGDVLPASGVASTPSDASAPPPPVPPTGAGPRPPATDHRPAAEGRFSVTSTPRARCWVNVRSNGKVVFAATMKPGDRQDLALGGSVSLTVGDAGAMVVEINGQPARPLGGAGQVRTLR